MIGAISKGDVSTSWFSILILYKESSNLPSSYPLEDLHEALTSPRDGRRKGKLRSK
jgi:hypothetical protein